MALVDTSHIVRATGGLSKAEASAQGLGEVWAVVGGAEKGGIVVRQGFHPDSPKEPERLSTGALVKAVDFEDGRLCYELLQGTGPICGWVLTKLHSKDLLVQVAGRREESPLIENKNEQVCSEAWEALRIYGGRLGSSIGGTAKEEILPVPQTSTAKVGPCLPAGMVRQQMAKDLARKTVARKQKRQGRPQYDDDSDGEHVPLCTRCNLPVGEVGYREGSLSRNCMHSECMAQEMQQRFREEEEKREKDDANMRMEHRSDYNIGWKPTEQIPQNECAAEKLGCDFAAKGMCCLVLDGAGGVRVVPTVEPAAAVNLEYLSIALRLRALEGREPFFSLEPTAGPPTSCDDPRSWMQKKIFQPEWLAGTSAGEVMFQADYYLKELSMGACEQPVAGMKCVFDYTEREGFDMEWSAREWFVVRKAEIQVSEDNVIIPYLKMGVEAREQTWSEDVLEDSRITRPDHPLVKYAEEFTKNFDLIAERRSVIYHLRELAKATVMAKYLVEAEVPLDAAWLDLAEASNTECPLEVPCAWTDRAHSKIQLQDGMLVDEAAQQKLWKFNRSVYGGVQFGIERFSLSAPAAAIRAGIGRIAGPMGGLMIGISAERVTQPLSTMRTARPATPFKAMSAIRIAAPMRMGVPAAAVARPPPGVPGVPAARPPEVFVAPIRQTLGYFSSHYLGTRPQTAFDDLTADLDYPKGVDLGLSKFDLSRPQEVVRETSSAKWGDVAIASAFWSGLRGGEDGALSTEDRSLLKAVFNPRLSDRREEGDLFVPPDTSFSHVQALQHLTKTEEVLKQQRQRHFLSEDFTAAAPGSLFPSSWSSQYQITRGEVLADERQRSLVTRPDFLARSDILEHVLASAAPTFDKTTEDGIRFRCYTIGSLEVRTTQETDGKEIIGAVLSPAPSMESNKQGARVKADDKVTRATLCVDAAEGPKGYHYFVVLDCESGSTIVTERLADGTTTWEENPVDVEERISLARIVRGSGPQGKRVMLAALMSHRAKEITRFATGASFSHCKRYAQGAFDLVTGMRTVTPWDQVGERTPKLKNLHSDLSRLMGPSLVINDF